MGRFLITAIFILLIGSLLSSTIPKDEINCDLLESNSFGSHNNKRKLDSQNESGTCLSAKTNDAGYLNVFESDVIQMKHIDERIKEYRRRFLRNYIVKEYLLIITDRTSVFSSTYNLIHSYERKWFDGFFQVFVKFEEESGQDLGGLTKEWIQILLESFMTNDPERIFEFKAEFDRSDSQLSSRTETLNFVQAIFIQNSNGVYLPNTNYSPKVFEFVGTILALAFIFNLPIGVEFLPALYNDLSSTPEKEVNFESDLKLIDPKLYECIKLSENIVVLDNEFEFECKFKYFAYNIYEPQLNALTKGFKQFLGQDQWRNLGISSEILKNELKGSGELLFENFVEFVNTSKLSDFNTKSWIFEIISEFSNKERLKLYKFITSHRCVPFKGLKNSLPAISFISNSFLRSDFLPISSTCTSSLYIPIYESKDILRDKLMLAMDECETFDLD